MGQGLGTELGSRALFIRNRTELEEYLARLRTDDPELTELDLSNRFLGSDGAEFASVLCNNKNLKKLNLSYNKLEGGVIGKVTRSLGLNAGVRSLNLSGNPLYEEGGKLVSDLITCTHTLEELILFNCALDDHAALHIANAIQRNKSLRTLRLDMNSLTDMAAQMLAKAFARNTSLTVLTLTGNSGVTEHRSRALEAALQENRRRREVQEQRSAQKESNQRLRRERNEDTRRQAEAEQRKLKEELAKQHEEVLSKQREIEEEQDRLRTEREDAVRQESEVKEMARQQKTDYISTIVGNAYRWKEQKTSAGPRDWNSGFTVPQPAGGKDPHLTGRRLEACWCEPTDAPAGYSGQLHYHCKFEPDNAEVWNTDDSRKYEGCRPGRRCKDHRCASIGVYAKPRARDTAATFFSSRSPLTH